MRRELTNHKLLGIFSSESERSFAPDLVAKVEANDVETNFFLPNRARGANKPILPSLHLTCNQFYETRARPWSVMQR